MSSIIDQIRAELKANTDPQTQKSFQHFFQTTSKILRCQNSNSRKNRKKTLETSQPLRQKSHLPAVRRTLLFRYTEEAFIVAFWLPNYIDHLDPDDLPTFKGWIEEYINNWAKCDGFCNHTLGDLIEKYPRFSQK